MATLVVMSGPAMGRLLAIPPQGAVTIGRDDLCTFQIVDEHMSRKHAQVRFESGPRTHIVLDYRSANGVFINEKQIDSEGVIDDGDTLRLGGTTMVFLLKDYDDAKIAMKDARAKEEWRRGTITERRSSVG